MVHGKNKGGVKKKRNCDKIFGKKKNMISKVNEGKRVNYWYTNIEKKKKRDSRNRLQKTW